MKMGREVSVEISIEDGRVAKWRLSFTGYHFTLTEIYTENYEAKIRKREKLGTEIWIQKPGGNTEEIVS